jgi:hypothetical protein
MKIFYLLVMCIGLYTSQLFAQLNWQQKTEFSNNVYAMTISGNNLISGSNNIETFANNIIKPYSSGQISALYTKDNYTYAGTKAGLIFVSTDNGNDWEASRIDTGFAIGSSITGFAKIGNNMMAGTADKGLIFSSDNGSTWSFMKYDLFNIVSSLVSLGNTFFEGVSGNGVYVSSDNGFNWLEQNNGLSFKSINCLALKDSTIYAGTRSGGVFYTSNLGLNWIPIGNGLLAYDVISIAVGDSIILMGTNGGGVYYSPNKYYSWTQVNNGLHDYSVTSLIIDQNRIYAGTLNGGVYQSNYYEISITGISGKEFCHGDTLTISFDYNGVFSDTSTFIVQLSDWYGEFKKPTNLGSVRGTSNKIIKTLITKNIIPGNDYLLRVINANTPALASTSFETITINPLPKRPFISDENKSLMSSSNNGNQWYLNGSKLKDSTSSTLYPSITGYYQVVVIDSQTGCKSEISDSVFFTYTDIDEINSSKANINITPNPATDFITISGINDINITPKDEKVEIRIYNLYFVLMPISLSERQRIDVSGLSSGLYFVRIGDRVGKFLKL